MFKNLRTIVRILMGRRVALNAPSRSRMRFRPTLKAFEDRILPSTYTWQGGTGNNWSTPANWTSSDGGTSFPQAGDSATIDIVDTVNYDPAAGGTVDALTINNANARLVLNASMTVANTFTMHAGKIDTASINNVLTLNSQSTWDGGWIGSGDRGYVRSVLDIEGTSARASTMIISGLNAHLGWDMNDGSQQTTYEANVQLEGTLAIRNDPIITIGDASYFQFANPTNGAPKPLVDSGGSAPAGYFNVLGHLWCEVTGGLTAASDLPIYIEAQGELRVRGDAASAGNFLVTFPNSQTLGYDVYNFNGTINLGVPGSRNASLSCPDGLYQEGGTFNVYGTSDTFYGGTVARDGLFIGGTLALAPNIGAGAAYYACTFFVRGPGLTFLDYSTFSLWLTADPTDGYGNIQATTAGGAINIGYGVTLSVSVSGTPVDPSKAQTWANIIKAAGARNGQFFVLVAPFYISYDATSASLYTGPT
jgi:hypothetical protein